MARGTVLVVEDDAVTAQMIETVLSAEGYEVAITVDGGALELAPRLRPTVILLDMKMPGMDGAEVSKRLRDNPETEGIPIVLMSAHVRGQTPDLPVDGFLGKPFAIDDLCALVSRYSRAGSHLPNGR